MKMAATVYLPFLPWTMQHKVFLFLSFCAALPKEANSNTADVTVEYLFEAKFANINEHLAAFILA
jgi:hypothetical protein